MKIPLSWLKEYIDLSFSPAQIAKMLTMAGLEVDGVETLSLGFEKVVVGRVLEVQKHPEADKLCIASVSDGVETYQVVCGAPNCRPGIKTAFAVIGATLTVEGRSLKIKKSKLRGVESFGMLCSAKELNLSNEEDGIIEFADHLKEGADVAEMYADTVFDISLTPNLGHCSSVIGVARELSAITGLPVKYPKIAVQEAANDPITSHVDVSVIDEEECPRYVCRLIENVVVKDSPDWLQKRLISCGLRPINQIVDVTNYVLLELGHPLHAFDYDLIEGKQVIVRKAKEGESFTTLDGKERKLNSADLLICDQSKPIALAGIMGGANSEVSESTRNVLLEAAYFSPTTIRKTSKRLGLQTDASKRFERGTDPNILINASARAAMLIQQVSGGTLCEGIRDTAKEEISPKQISCRFNRINQILGTKLSVGEVESILLRLGLKYEWSKQDTFLIEIPTYRNDLKEEIDLIEEVARLYGYDNITQASCRFTSSSLPDAPIFLFEREIRSRLISEGLQEFLTCDLIGPNLLKVINEEMPQSSLVKVLNPTSVEQSILRTSLLPGLLQVVKYNWDHQNQNIVGFEVGRIHFKEGEQYKEQSVAGIVLSGNRFPRHWDSKPQILDFFDLKGIIENLLSELNIQNVSFKANHLESFHPGRQAAIYVDSLEIGSFGEVHPAILRRLDVPQRILFAELNLHDLLQVKKSDQKMRELPIYPGSERDWTVTLKSETQIMEIIRLVRSFPSRLLEEVALLDIYESEKLGKGLKNATFRFMYRDLKKTIEQERVDTEHSRLTTEVTNLIKINNFG